MGVVIKWLQVVAGQSEMGYWDEMEIEHKLCDLTLNSQSPYSWEFISDTLELQTLRFFIRFIM